jgi:hypothetical protein
VTSEGSTPSVVRVVTVTTEDAVAALEANLRRSRGLVLRLTPPFHGRQRARLHRPTPADDDARSVAPASDADEEEEGGGADARSPGGWRADDAVHLDPAALFTDAPPYPEVDETAARLRADGEYDTDRHYEVHAERVAEWRASLRDARADSVTLSLAGRPHRVRVRWLG